MQNYIVPRNIKVKEGIVYGLNGKQVLFLIVGGLGVASVWLYGDAFGTSEKLAGSALCTLGSLSLMLAKPHGQSLDEYTTNMIKYAVSTKEFGGDESVPSKAPVLRIKYSLQ